MRQALKGNSVFDQRQSDCLYHHNAAHIFPASPTAHALERPSLSAIFLSFCSCAAYLTPKPWL